MLSFRFAYHLEPHHLHLLLMVMIVPALTPKLSRTCDILSRNVTKYPMLKIHASSWTGTAEDMFFLLETFPENVWFGLDSTVTFAKQGLPRA
mmetsp:Transcript_20281/g.36797  ORF Transcript_20281/g.36797 Transcript_20281/m.36797 type:complete len:92 (+) Transcript_20281:724-999(+)